MAPAEASAEAPAEAPADAPIGKDGRTLVTGPTIVRIRDGTLVYDARSVPRESPLCWHCCHSWTGPSIPCPLTYDERRDVYTVCGAFCSHACMHAYARDRGKIHPGCRSPGVTYRLFRAMTGQTSFPVAPPRQMLQSFGGDMTIDEFRNHSKSYSYREVPSNCIVSPSILLQYEQGTMVRHAANKFVSVKRRDDSLRLAPTKGTSGHVTSTNVNKKQKTLLETTLGL